MPVIAKGNFFLDGAKIARVLTITEGETIYTTDVPTLDSNEDEYVVNVPRYEYSVELAISTVVAEQPDFSLVRNSIGVIEYDGGGRTSYFSSRIVTSGEKTANGSDGMTCVYTFRAKSRKVDA